MISKHYILGVLWQVMYDPSPTLPADQFSPEFCSFVDACLQKDANARPTAEQVSLRNNLSACFSGFHQERSTE